MILTNNRVWKGLLDVQDIHVYTEYMEHVQNHAAAVAIHSEKRLPLSD